MKERETVLNRKVHIADLVLEVPELPPLCDSLPVRKRRVDVGDCKLYCEEEGSGTPLVLLHGGPGATHHYFHPEFTAAADFARVIYYDQRGCGLSDYEPGERYSVQQAVEDLDTLREALGVEKWVVLGHSHGGMLAQCYAMRCPDRVHGLVLVGAGFWDAGPDAHSREYDFMSPEERQRKDSIYADGSLSLVQQLFNAHRNGDWKRQSFYRPTDAELARMARYEWVHDDAFRGPMRRSAGRLRMEGAFDGCPLPVLIAEGRWDLSFDEGKAERIYEYIAGSKLRVFDRSGHNPFDDEPEAFFAELRQFIESLEDVPEERVAAWRVAVAARQEAAAARELEIALQKSLAERLLGEAGWGRRSSETIAEAYSPDWLDQAEDVLLLLKAGFALHDVGRYDDALDVFRTMQDKSSESTWSAVALVWQGHMLDALGRREEAVAAYESVVRMDVRDSVCHDQYGLCYRPSAWAAERVETPFERVENRYPD